MRRIMGALVGFLLFFPGAMLLRWLVVEELGLYQEMSLTDALLAIVIIVACVIIFGQPRRAMTAEELEEQARRMELASRRLEQARRSLRSRRFQSMSGTGEPSAPSTGRRPSSRRRG